MMQNESACLGDVTEHLKYAILGNFKPASCYNVDCMYYIFRIEQYSVSSPIASKAIAPTGEQNFILLLHCKPSSAKRNINNKRIVELSTTGN
jgi:hypothetical protein